MYLGIRRFLCFPVICIIIITFCLIYSNNVKKQKKTNIILSIGTQCISPFIFKRVHRNYKNKISYHWVLIMTIGHPSIIT